MSRVCRPCQPPATSNSVRPHTRAPREDVHRRQWSALAGVRCTVKSSAGVGISTSPFCSQSNKRPMVWSCLATYPSRDMMALATTVPIDPRSSAALRLVDLHDDAAGERRGLDELQVPSVRQLVEQDQRLDEQVV